MGVAPGEEELSKGVIASRGGLHVSSSRSFSLSSQFSFRPKGRPISFPTPDLPWDPLLRWILK